MRSLEDREALLQLPRSSYSIASVSSRRKIITVFLLVFVTFAAFIFLTPLDNVPNIFVLLRTTGGEADWPKNYTKDEYRPRLGNLPKRIIYWTSIYGEEQYMNRKLECGPQGSQVCELVTDRSLISSSHAVIFHGWREDMLSTESNKSGIKIFTPTGLPPVRYRDQYWVLFMLESPYNYREQMRCYDPLFNWTATYRTDSDVYVPYGRFQMLPKPVNISGSMVMPPSKTKTIAWILSNCRDVPSKRLDLVKKLQEHISVDIYGKCGNLTCKSSGQKDCKIEIGQHYKFYLALENSLCQDYMTEKVFNAYSGGMVPIVYGSANYDLFLPRGSYININSYPTVELFAAYLLHLDKNPEEYMKIFEWRRYMQLSQESFDSSSAYCGLCEKVHRDYPGGVRKLIPNMTDWLFRNQEKNYPVCNEPLVW